MPLPKNFIRAWYAWLRVPEFTFKTIRYADGSSTDSSHDSIVSEIMNEMDHMDTYLHGLGVAAISGEASEYSQLASEQLVILERLESELENCQLLEEQMQEYRSYIEATRALLKEMVNLPS